MILLNKSQSNRLALTLRELSGENEPYNWLFVFTLEQDDSYSYTLYLTDDSDVNYPDSTFTLIEGTDVTFRFLGDYNYKVFQMPDGGSTNTSLGTKVEEGKMRLIDTPVEVSTFNVDNNSNIYDQASIS